MEAVRAFNNELSALYEGKPPISRAKMAQLTKCAIKAIKFYKHVVQSVEKFIQKCKPEYKVPGLYVIDSVVRQSRHQFGSHKDVFAPRFTKNIITTFQNLFKCPGEERSKIVRVLNLWQKNEVFPSEIIQPLLDLAADPTKPSAIAAVQAAVDRVMANSGKPSSSSQPQPPLPQPPSEASAPAEPPGDEISQAAAESMLATQNDMLNTVTQLLQQTDSGNTSLSAQQQQLQQLQLLQQQLIQQTQLMQQPSGAGPIIDSNLLAQIQTLTNQLLAKTETKPEGGGFNTKLLDFDYGDSDDEEDRRQPNETNVAGNVQTILNDSTLMQQIHQMSQTIQKTEQLKTELSEQEKRRRVLEQQQAEFDQQIAHGIQPPPPPFSAPPPPAPDDGYREEGEYEEEQLLDEDFRDHHQLRDRDDSRDVRRDRRRRSRDRSTRSSSPKRRRRSRSRSKERRRRSRSKDKDRTSTRSKDRDRQKEKEKERKKKFLPPLRGNNVTICTMTIWIGHLNKFTSEEELKAELEHYGPVESINMVPPRGCAYVVMSNRKDAFKAIDRLKGYKLNGSALKTAWAQSKGMRDSSYKGGWDVENGSMYIPWDKLPGDLTAYLEGGIIDPDSLPEHLKDIPTEKVKLEDQVPGAPVPPGQPQQMNMGQQHPQMPGQPPMMGMMPPPPGQMPPGMPAMMQGMMMQMQRPMGMPPPNMGMPPGPPQQMMPGTAPIPMPGVRPGGPVNTPMSPMSITNTAASTLAQNIQNIMASTAGTLGTNSPAIPPRPAGFPPGTPPRFNFNPNMPPPGFRMPPPGFGGPVRPMMPAMAMNKPSEPGKMGERPPMMENPSMKMGMAWPPDSNEKDEDIEEDDDETMEGNDKPANNIGQFGSSFRGQQNMLPGSQDQSPMRMLGPRQPGGFPPGPPPGAVNQPWNMMRMGGPRNMRPNMGDNRMGGPNMMPPMGGNNQDMFNSPRPPMMGMGGGPRFMGNMPPGNQGGPGFPRFPGGSGGPKSNMKGPVSLLDLDLKPPDGFHGQTFNDDEEPNDNENNMDMDENFEEGENIEEQNEEENPRQNVYPFNTWQSINKGDRGNHNGDRSRGRDRSNRDIDDSRNRGDRDDVRNRGDKDDNRSRNRDDERNKSRDDDRNKSRDDDRNKSRDDERNKSRDDDRNKDRRDSRDRDKDRQRDRDRDRGDSSRNKDDRRDRDGSRRDRGSRSSRWGNVEDDNKNSESEITQVQNASGDISDNQVVKESSNNSHDKSDDVIKNAEIIPPSEASTNAIVNNKSDSGTQNLDTSGEIESVTKTDAIESCEVEKSEVEVEISKIKSAELICDKVENSKIESGEIVGVEVESSEIESGEVVGDEVESGNTEKVEVSETVNGPLIEDTPVTPNNKETLKAEIPRQTDSNDNVESTNDNIDSKENVDLEEGELSS